MPPAILLATACAPKVAPEASDPIPPAEETTPSAAAPLVVTGPSEWSEPGGLCMSIPAGWSGTTGPPPEVLALDAEVGGVHLEVHVLPLGTTPITDRPGLVLAFEDLSSYRTVPLLAPSSLRSWQPLDPSGPTVMAWWNEVDGRTVAVEATFPNGRSTEGLDRVEPLLEALCSR
jgi:hypothetical protein